LRDAGEYIAALPPNDQREAHWHLAAEMLLMAAEGRGPLMFAHIAMLRALHHDRPAPQPEPRKKRAKFNGTLVICANGMPQTSTPFRYVRIQRLPPLGYTV
jgi:hypothetical protein